MSMISSAVEPPQSPRAVETAAALTDLVMDVLAGAGVHGDSVEMELGAWRALTLELERESRWRRWVPMSIDAVTNGLVEQVVHRAALAVAEDHVPSASERENRIHPAVADLSVTASHRAAVAGLFPRPTPEGRPLGRSGLVRRIGVTTLN